TVRTEHFTVHYPAEMAEWTLDVAERLEAVHAEVTAAVGFTPEERVTIVVEDPSNSTNGFAYPFLDAPVIALWPTPPDPRSVLGHTRDAPEQLVVHEFAHIAHLTRPSRNPQQAFWTRLSPIRIGPVARKAPRWVTEGYATWVEGKLTGYGRPHSVVRAAVLRQWALEGRLPTYAQLSRSGDFQGGAMAYLAGSAFLEWLAARSGEESLTNLWRRLSARRERSFDDAFAGTFGGPPRELYGRFTVELTERALEARRELRAAGIVEGDTVQRLAWQTGDPAVSPDGARMAVVLRGAPGSPSRVVLWSTADEPADSAEAAARRKLLEADPEDVPDVPWRPRPRKPLATLLPVAGRGHDQPRFTPDGAALLVVRQEPTDDGTLRPDLFLWRWREKSLRRVTRGASVRSPDPSPDGRSAAAVRCLGGICDLVRVDLASGEISVITKGSPRRVFYRPRWSPDGRWIAASLQENGGWRLVRVDPATGALAPIGPDDGASRYDADFRSDGRLVVVSERGGIANLELLDPVTGEATSLTRVTGAAAAPEVNPATGHVFYLSLHAGGLDLMRVHPDSVRANDVVALGPALAPAAPIATQPRDTLVREPAPASRGYGIGPRRFRILPGGSAGPDGAAAEAVAVNGDPIGRLTVLVRAVWALPRVPVGASEMVVWRGWRPSLAAEGFWMRHRPSEGDLAVLDDGRLDADYAGGALHAERSWAASTVRQRLRLGASVGWLETETEGDGGRDLGFAEYTAWGAATQGRRSISGLVSAHLSAGRTLGEDWRRALGSASLGVASGPLNLRGDAWYGVVTDDAPEWERFAAGGAQQTLVSDVLLPQRLPRPGTHFGVVEGTELAAWRVSTRVAGITPYLWSASGDPPEGGWYRVLGAEASLTTEAQSLLGIPALRLMGGVAYPLTEPFRRELRAYASVSLRP
ncbi:MAG TPA: hypothetical protein VFQ39_05420, partial [Longimicrobium sp.]|nr:hypothetical protein [Longimicrobium sp.]